MSNFIAKEDYQPHIRDNRLDAIIELDDDKLDTTEKRAIKVMKSHLAARFDVTAIFNETGLARDEAILGYCLDISIYYLYRMANPRKVPSYRKDAYDEAIEWMNGVKEGSIVPDGLPPLQNVDGNGNSENASYYRFGSNKKRENHI